MATLQITKSGYSFRLEKFKDVTVEFQKCSARAKLEIAGKIQPLIPASGEIPTASAVELIKISMGYAKIKNLNVIMEDGADPTPITDAVEFYGLSAEGEDLENILHSVNQIAEEFADYYLHDKKKHNSDGGKNSDLGKSGGTKKRQAVPKS